MQQRLRNLYNRAVERWSEFDKNQKRNLLITVTTVVIALVALILFLARTPMYIVYRNLDYVSAGEITSALTEAGINNRTARNATEVLVAEKDMDRALMLLSEKNIPSTGSFDFATAFTYMGMGTTESVKKKTMNIYDEKDLEAKLKKNYGIKDATVKLVLANEDRYFIKDEQRATASVQLFAERTFTKADGVNIARYISKCVKNLEMEDIVVIDGNFNTIYSGAVETGFGETISTQEEKRQLRIYEIEKKLREMILPQMDDVRIYADIVLNWDVQTDQSTTYGTQLADSETSLPIRESTSQSSVSGTAPGDVPGTDTNNNATPQYQTGDNSGYSGSTRDKETDYALDTFVSTSERATGTVDYNNSSLVIMMYKYRTYYEQDMTETQLNGLTWVEFKDANNFARSRTVEPELRDAIRTLQISNTSVTAYELPVFIDKEPVEPTDVSSIILYVIMILLILLLGFGVLRKMQPDEVVEIEPELSVEELLVSTQMEDEKIAEVEKLQEIAFNQESEAKRQIEKFVLEKPEAVAQLLRNWLNDEWGD